MAEKRYRIGIDVGGTFTDFVLADMAERELWFHKEPSVPDDPSAAVDQGIRALIENHGISAQSVELIVHGTTIGLNAIIQRRGARMALVVSQGTRDVLEIARMRLPSSYDFTEPRETPLVPRNLVFEVSARMDARGRVLQGVDAAEIKELAAQLKTADVEAVAIMLLNSYRDPSLEIEIGHALRNELGGLLITESSVVWPEIREYERCLVAGLNSYIQPLMTSYFDRLESRVKSVGLECPIYITANNGGTLGIDTARSRPIDTVLSGPASGVVASTRVGAASDINKLITFDMGGTSADISVCQRGTPEFTSSTFVGDFPLMMPVVNVAAIGAGGGSILWVDDLGLLKVGPLSAGAAPGPICYGRGGDKPTVTDCYVTLGIIDPDNFLSGRMQLDAAAARNALDAIAEQLGMEGPDRALEAAEAAIRVATAKMATEINKLLAHAGVDPRDFSLMAYGGAGATHANLLADEARLTSVLVPTAPGTFCALGAVLADVRRDYVTNARYLIGGSGQRAQDDWNRLTAQLAEMEDEARRWVEKEGDLIGAHDFAVSINLRYPSQAYELEIFIPPEQRERLSAALVSQLFHDEHQKLYGFNEPDSSLQTSTLRLGVIGRVAPVTLPNVGDARPTTIAARKIWHGGRYLDAAVYRREELGQGATVNGPAVIEQPDTTIFLLPGWNAEAGRQGTLRLRREVQG